MRRSDKLTKAARKLNEREHFFYRHAGYSYDPKTETRDAGRIRCAKNLAAAELYAQRLNWRYDWEEDWDIGSHKAYYGKGSAYEDREPNTCESCTLYDTDEYGEYSKVLASLGCIDDADANYRRVIEAELADEAISRELAEADRIAKVDQFIAVSYAL